MNSDAAIDTSQLPSFETGRRPTFRMVVRDISIGLSQWELWGAMAWQDIKQRYRSSILGPFWVTISMGVLVLMWSLIFGQIMKVPTSEYLSFLTLGFVVWLWMSNTMNESTVLFAVAQRYIKQMRQPTTLFIFRLIAKNLIVFAHNFAVYLIVAIFAGLNPGWTGLLAIPGMILGIVTMFWVSLLFAMFGARFRDFPQIVHSIVQVVFYVTPILWRPDLLGGKRQFLIDYNPVYYFIEIVRAPLLGHMPPIGYWKVTILATFAATLFVFPLFRRFRGRVAYWA